ncbi:S-layer homology domain-containing protein [Brevibacillus choshinensis]|uniref:S-layer homology domain-containing protein n=1 Tax=Brevibacillus choshinensis TaxID=54911 RepID=A0ABX7FNA7_BRECH|nr:S-layer homology domain-containing protein [Brevibacillus choshinensis]QRG67726.1 S-layer homology domain-containing protein [Brevibacillus choshinensis]
MMGILRPILIFALLFCFISQAALAQGAIPQDAKYNSDAVWALNLKIIKPYPDGRFYPDKPVSEAEFLDMLFNYYKVKLPTNANSASYAHASTLKWPIFSNTEARKKPMTREHAAELLSASLGVNYRAEDAVYYLFYNRFINYTDKPTLASFKAKSILTRVDAVHFIRMLEIRGNLTIKPIHDSPSMPKIGINDEALLKPIKGSILLSADRASQPSVDSFVKNLKIMGNTLTGTIPNIPVGYSYSIIYRSGHKWGVGDKAIKGLNPGQTFSVDISKRGEKAGIDLFLDIEREGMNGVYVDIPSLQADYVAERAIDRPFEISIPPAEKPKLKLPPYEFIMYATQRFGFNSKYDGKNFSTKAPEKFETPDNSTYSVLIQNGVNDKKGLDLGSLLPGQSLIIDISNYQQDVSVFLLVYQNGSLARYAELKPKLKQQQFTISLPPLPIFNN